MRAGAGCVVLFLVTVPVEAGSPYRPADDRARLAGRLAHPDHQRVEPIFRTRKEGEERVEGLLQRIDCSLRGAVVFVVQTSDQTVRLSAPKMKDVEFITYREDVTGDVKCGALKEPMRVYVTSREPSKPKGKRVVVAVEFLPKDQP